MVGVSVSEAATELGVSRQRVVQLIGAGRIAAVRVGRGWVIPEAGLAEFQAARRPGVRPMSARMARGMVDLVGQHLGIPAGEAWSGLADRDRSRLRRHWQQLIAVDNPAVLLRGWLPQRCRVERFVLAGDPAELLADPRVGAGGASHPELSLSGGEIVEPHVAEVDRDDVVGDWLLVPAVDGNVMLRSEPVVRVDLAACLADVADLGGGRNEKAVAEVLKNRVAR